MDLDAVVAPHLARHLVARHYFPDGSCGLLDDSRVFDVQDDSKFVHVAVRRRDTAVAQVETQQIHVGARQTAVIMGLAPTPTARRAWRPGHMGGHRVRRDFAYQPIRDGPARNTDLVGDIGGIQTV
jgi:hypothetical protein